MNDMNELNDWMNERHECMNGVVNEWVNASAMKCWEMAKEPHDGRWDEIK